MEAREAALNLIQYSTERVVDLVGWPSPLVAVRLVPVLLQ